MSDLLHFIVSAELAMFLGVPAPKPPIELETFDLLKLRDRLDETIEAFPENQNPERKP
jgi:hypothetical protein